VGPERIRVNAITPGFFPAEQNRSMLLRPDGTYTERGQRSSVTRRMGRFGDAPELRRAVSAGGLAGSSFSTGPNLVVDGGVLVRHL